ncbi:MAG: Na/Pi cotransporter family protein [Verrucomicrobiae bacterium]|nr:Na/Pi cotransporter family protein [Verrucomicrobiae bacterium]
MKIPRIFSGPRRVLVFSLRQSDMTMFASITLGSTLSTLLQVLGSLGVFLYGMKVMSEGVQRVAGSRMRTALSTLTTNRFSGILTGFATTSLVQSSSATTVLVVSFVNAGLLTLIQSIGLIMGANLGTTVTAWIVAMVGSFSVAKISLPMIGISLPFLFIGKDKAKSWGEVLLGFGLVFFGLGLLKESVPDLKTMVHDDPDTAATIQHIVTWMGGRGFLSVLLYLAGGVLLTLMVQSSSAAMAITITCAINGWLGDIHGDPVSVFRNSAAIVLGENIGTTVTAWLASIGANTNAKRAARAHFLFNVIGVCWMLALFVPFTNGAWWIAEHLPASLKEASKDFSKSSISFATAIFHTTFNFANICVLVAFVPLLARIVEWWVKEPAKGTEPAKLRYISQGLVDLGELNMAEAESAAGRMNDLVSRMFDGFVDVFRRPDEDLSAQVAELKRMEDESDEMLQDLTSYLIQCSTHEIGAGNATRISSLLRIASELEETADRIYRLVKVSQRRFKSGKNFSAEQIAEVESMCRGIRSMLDLCTTALKKGNHGTLEESTRIEDEIDALRKKHNKGAIARMQNGGDVPTEILFTEINNHLEAVANHALNIIQNAQPRQSAA